MEDKEQISDEILEDVDGGRILSFDRPQTSNFCPRCRNSGYLELRREGNIQLRKCKTCGLEYKYRA